MRFEHRGVQAAAAAAVILVLLLYYTAVLSPVWNRQARLLSLIEIKQSDLDDMRRMTRQARQLQWFEGRVGRPADPPSGAFSLLSFVGKAAREIGLEKRIKSIRPVPEAVADGHPAGSRLTVVLEEIDTGQLVALLETIEAGTTPTIVEGLRVQRTQNPENMARIRATIEIRAWGQSSTIH